MRPGDGANLAKPPREFNPSLAAIRRSIKLAERSRREAEHWVGTIDRQKVNRALHRAWQADILPALTIVAAAIKPPVPTGIAASIRQIQHARAIWPLDNAAGVLPGRVQLAKGPMLPVVLARVQPERRRREQLSPAVLDNRHPVNVRGSGVQSGITSLERAAAVVTDPGIIDLDAGADQIWIVGVEGDLTHAGPMLDRIVSFAALHSDPRI